MIEQLKITLKPKSRGFHLVTSEIAAPLTYAASPINGEAQICKHTSCGLSINENTDPDVRVDMNGRLNMRTWQGIYFCEYRNYGGARDFSWTRALLACQSKNNHWRVRQHGIRRTIRTDG